VPKGPIYDYSISINPQQGVKKLRTRIFEFLEAHPLVSPHLSYIAHDQSQRLVSAKKLPQPLSIAIKYYDEGRTAHQENDPVYTITIKFERELHTPQLQSYMEGNPQFRDYDPLPLISGLNLVLQQHAARTGIAVGKDDGRNEKKYLFPGREKFMLSTGLEAFRGYTASVRPGYKQLMVNVYVLLHLPREYMFSLLSSNVCMTAFIIPGEMEERLDSFNRNSHGAMPSLPKDMVQSIKVTTQYLGYKRKYTVQAISTTSARNTFFQGPQGRISVEQYFLKSQFHPFSLIHTPPDLVFCSL